MFILAGSTCYPSRSSRLKHQFFYFVFQLNTVSSSSALLKKANAPCVPFTVDIIVSDVNRVDVCKCFQNVIYASWFEEKVAGLEPIRNREIF